MSPVPSALIALVLALSLLPMRAGAALSRALDGVAVARGAVVVERAHAARERGERARGTRSEARPGGEVRPVGTGAPPLITLDLLPATAPGRLRAPRSTAALAPAWAAPASPRDQRDSIRRARAAAHVPHAVDDDPVRARLA